MIGSTKLISLGFLFIGIFFLMQVMMPLISFQIWNFGQSYNSRSLISPLGYDNKNILGVSIQNNDNFSAFVSSLSRESKAPYSQFYISIPKIKVDNALVKADSNDLSNNLAHLPGSALPGEKGNVFVSGHSALSSLFNMKNAVFANLLGLQKGDQIIVDAAGIKFTYQVIEFKVIDSKDLSVILPPDSIGRYISLMTCVPPGLNFKRLVVLGKML